MQCRWRSLVLVTEGVLRGQTVLLVRWQFGLRARHVGQVRASIPRSREGRRGKDDPRPDRGVHIQPLGEPETCQPKFICGLRRQGSEVRMTGLSTGIYFNAARAVTMEEYTSNPRR